MKNSLLPRVSFEGEGSDKSSFPACTLDSRCTDKHSDMDCSLADDGVKEVQNLLKQSHTERMLKMEGKSNEEEWLQQEQYARKQALL